jgi:hypothetical protein
MNHLTRRSLNTAWLATALLCASAVCAKIQVLLGKQRHARAGAAAWPREGG